MEISSFENDLLDLGDFSVRLNKFISSEVEFVDGSLVVSLSSKFGYGKTTFLNMWKDSFESGSDESLKPIIVSLNAWESDYYGDPLFSIISGLVGSIRIDNEAEADRIVSAAKDIGWFATAIGSQVARRFTGVDPAAAGEFSQRRKLERQGGGQSYSDAFSVYEARRNAMQKLKAALRDFLSSTSPTVMFFVDELDRCRPDYAIDYLETIKHIFDIKGAVFILAVDRSHLENSAKTAFGSDLDFDEYYRKFVDREVSLPAISDASYKRLASEYVRFYLERGGDRYCFMENVPDRIPDIVAFVEGLRLTPRQVKEVFRILGHVLETSEEKNRGRLLRCLASGCIAMAVISVGDRRMFRLLGNQQLDPQDAKMFLMNIFGDVHRAYWWFNLFLTGGGIARGEDETCSKVLSKVGFVDDVGGSVPEHELSEWFRGWGIMYSDRSRLNEVYRNILQVGQWD